MKFSFCIVTLFLLIYSSELKAQRDSLSLPSFKISLDGSIAITKGWEAQDRTFKGEWYEYEKVPNTSTGLMSQIIFSKKIFKTSSYLSGGLGIVSFDFQNFRLKTSPDMRYAHGTYTIYDTSYSNYTAKSITIPIYFQFPISTKGVYFSFKAGASADLTFSETYDISGHIISDSLPDTYSNIQVRNYALRYTGTRVLLGVSVEFSHFPANIVPVLSTTFLTYPTGEHSWNKNFLHCYSFNFSLGLAYYFRKK